MPAPGEGREGRVPPAAAAGEREDTGLPFLPTWRGVYVFVIGSFVLWVVLLFLLSVAFR